MLIVFDSEPGRYYPVVVKGLKSDAVMDQTPFQRAGEGILALELRRDRLMAEGAFLDVDHGALALAGIMPLPEGYPLQILFRCGQLRLMGSQGA